MAVSSGYPLLIKMVSASSALRFPPVGMGGRTACRLTLCLFDEREGSLESFILGFAGFVLMSGYPLRLGLGIARSPGRVLRLPGGINSAPQPYPALWGFDLVDAAVKPSD